MTPLQALADALTFLAGARDSGPSLAERDAALLLERLRSSGFGVVPIPAPGRGRYSPSELRSKREGLGLGVKRLAREAGVQIRTVHSVEQPGSRAHRETIETIAATLDRLSGLIAPPDAFRARRRRPAQLSANARRQRGDDGAEPDKEA